MDIATKHPRLRPDLPPLGLRRTFYEWCSAVSVSAEMLERVREVAHPETGHVSLRTLYHARPSALDAVEDAPLCGSRVRAAVERLQCGEGDEATQEWRVAGWMDRTSILGACLTVACDDEDEATVRGVVARACAEEGGVPRMLAWKEDSLSARTPLCVAVRRNNAGMMRVILEAAVEAGMSLRSSSGMFADALAHAGEHNCIDAMCELVRAGVPVDSTGGPGNYTALQKACSKGNVRAVSCLLNTLGANPAAVGGDWGAEATGPYLACLSGRISVIRELRSTLPECNDTDTRVWRINASEAGQTPLTCMVWRSRSRDDMELLAELLALGADLNVHAVEDGARVSTPVAQALHSATFSSVREGGVHVPHFLHMATALVERGARVDVASDSVATPLAMARALEGGDGVDVHVEAELQCAAMRASACGSVAHRSAACVQLWWGLESFANCKMPMKVEEAEEKVGLSFRMNWN